MPASCPDVIKLGGESEFKKMISKKVTEDLLIEKIQKRLNLSKADAKKYYKNALLYNIVQNAIIEQVDFLYFNKAELF